MRLSIVTISYNQAKFLERALLSIVDQGFPELQYIVVDPGSTDGSRELIDKHRNRIDRVIFEPDNGPADGLNRGFREATGDIFGYLNSDDAYLPGAFRKIADAFSQHPDADVIYGHGYIVDDRGNRLRRFYSDPFSSWRFVHGGCSVMQQSTFFRKKAFYNTNGFNPQNRIWWDAELLLDFSMAGMKMLVINDFLSIFTIHDQSISGQKYTGSALAKSLETEREHTRERLFRKAMGHTYNRWTRLFMALARIQKWMLQPTGFMWRFLEKVILRHKYI